MRRRFGTLKPLPNRAASRFAKPHRARSPYPRALLALLLDLDDLATDEPVRVDHRRVDRSARRARAPPR